MSHSVRVLKSEKRPLAAMWRALRPHQWLKNVLVFVPLVLAHRIRDVGTLERAFLAFAEFSLCASAAYLLNDLLDLEADRAIGQNAIGRLRRGGSRSPWRSEWR